MNKILMAEPEKITKWCWRLQAVLWLLMIGAYALLQLLLPKVEKREYLAQYFPVIIGITAVIIVAGHIKKLAYSKIPVYGYLCSAVIAIYGGYRYISYTGLQSYLKKPLLLVALAGAIYILFLAVNTLMGLAFRTLLKSVFYKKQFLSGLLVFGVINFIVYYYLPASTFFANYTEFGFPYQLLAIAFISNYLIWTIVPAMLMGVMRKEVFVAMYLLVFAVLVGIYVQYMFFNTNLGTINGEKYHWTAHPLLGAINMLVWLMILLGAYLLGKKKALLAGKVATYGAAFIGLVHLVTFATLFASKESTYFHYVDVNFSYEDQFRVGRDNNIIVFIIDAADNEFLTQLCEQDAEVLSQYKDFTFYTNTCSVYDYTYMSLLQMVTNVPFNNEVNNLERRAIAWNTPHATEFYDRFHEAGYKVEFFNFDNESTKYVLGKMDNAYSSAEGDNVDITYISYKTIRSDVGSLGAYLVLPTMLKGLAGIEDVDFCDIVIRQSTTNCYDNEDFEAHLNLSYGENDNYLLYQHLSGCHAPRDNADDFAYCLEIVAKYMQQMKDLGVYDNATIIVTADHGRHDPSDITGDGMFASTPIFMIKAPNQTQDAYECNGAPMYFTDLMPTLLYCAGLYDGDIELFGPTIYDFQEGDLRERTWFDRVNDPNYPKVGVYNTYYGYTYTGDTREFERVVANGENLVIYPVPIQNDGMY